MNPKKTTALWILNADYAEMSEEEIERQAEGLFRMGYGGAVPCAWGREGYLSESYFKAFGRILSALKKRNMHCVVWDEDSFPSGLSGRFLPEQYRARYLSRAVFSSGETPVCEGNPVAAFLRGADGVRREVSLPCAVPENTVLEVYECRLFTAFPMVDYLSREAVGAMIRVNRQPYYDRFPEFFGNTIIGFFFDEPSMHHVAEGRMISADFPEKFHREYGYSFSEVCPALFGDAGAGTAALRNDFFRLRAKLFAENYVGTLAGWCREHGVLGTGHFDQEEVLNPSLLTGDLLGAFRLQDVPGVDEIWNYGRAKPAYKLVASARQNFGKRHVHTEVFAAMGEELPAEILYREALDAFARGVDWIMPHGAWYDSSPEAVNAPPVLSDRNPRFAGVLPAFCGTCDILREAFEGMAPAPDIAVYYPLETLYADACFNEKSAYLGECNSLPARYFEVGEFLFNRLRRDFFYLHPENLLRASASSGTASFPVPGGRTEFRALILPDMIAATSGTLAKLRELLEGGVPVVFVGGTPSLSAERGKTDAEITALAGELLRHALARQVQSAVHYLFPGTVRECVPPVCSLESGSDPALGDFLPIRWRDSSGRERWLIANGTDYPARGKLVFRDGLRALPLCASEGVRTEEGKIDLPPRTYLILDVEEV